VGKTLRVAFRNESNKEIIARRRINYRSFQSRELPPVATHTYAKDAHFATFTCIVGIHLAEVDGRGTVSYHVTRRLGVRDFGLLGGPLADLFGAKLIAAALIEVGGEVGSERRRAVKYI